MFVLGFLNLLPPVTGLKLSADSQGSDQCDRRGWPGQAMLPLQHGVLGDAILVGWEFPLYQPFP